MYESKALFLEQQDILDEFIQEHTQDRDFFKTLDQGKVDEQGHYLNEEEQKKNIPTKPLIERLIEKSIAEPEVVVPKTDQELAEEPSLEEETEDFSYLDMPTKREDDGFDVESICSTYSNLENHPTIIQYGMDLECDSQNKTKAKDYQIEQEDRIALKKSRVWSESFL